MNLLNTYLRLNGNLVKTRLGGFWQLGTLAGTEDPTIPSLPLEDPPGTFDTGIFDRNIFDNILGPVVAGFTLPANGGTYAITGTAASLERGREVLALGGTYTITGTAANLERGREVLALAGSYAITGTAALLEFGREVIGGSGSYAITGTDATLTKSGGNKSIAGDGGSYAVTGTAASLEFGREVLALSGSYTITGTAASLERGREVLALGGSYAITGTAANLERGREVLALAGSYSLTGTDATLTKSGGNKVLTAEGGSYAISGTNATLVYGSTAITGGGHAWKDPAEPQYRVHPEYEDKPKKKRRKVTEPETIVFAPDLTVQTGIVPVRPAWDVMAELQQRADEAERIRRAKLRAIALADDEWLMVA